MKQQYTTCIYLPDPDGNTGLEGYLLGEKYRVQFIWSKKQANYVRVFPDPDDDGYYETCSIQTFKKYFSLPEEGIIWVLAGSPKVVIDV